MEATRTLGLDDNTVIPSPKDAGLSETDALAATDGMRPTREEPENPQNQTVTMPPGSPLASGMVCRRVLAVGNTNSFGSRVFLSRIQQGADFVQHLLDGRLRKGTEEGCAACFPVHALDLI